MRLRIGFVFAVLVLIFSAASCGDDPAPNNGSPDGGTTTDPIIDGGGDTPPTNPAASLPWKSGSRLRAQVERAAGDATRFETFVDTARSNEQCTFRTTSAGVRCLPSLEDVIYDDAACQLPVAIARPTCALGVAYAARYGQSATPCAGGELIEEVFAVGEPTTPRAGFQKLGDGTCIPRPVSELTYATLGAAIPFNAFVAANVVREDVSAAIARGRFMGEDGSELIDGTFYDRTRGGDACDVVRIGAGKQATRSGVCLTVRQAFAYDSDPVFSDPSCKIRVGTSYTPLTCPTPTVITRSERVDAGGGGDDAGGESLCSERMLTLHAAGAETTSSGAFGSPNGSCPPKPLMNGERGFVLGAPLNPATLPELVPAFASGTGRVRVRGMSSAGVVIEHGELWDDTENSSCSSATFSDGKRYCVTETTLIRSNVFKDASCLQPISLANDCNATPTFVVGQTPSSCSVVLDAVGHKLGTKLPTGTQYWTKVTAETCNGPLTVEAPFVAYDILGAIDVSTKLVEVTRAQE